MSEADNGGIESNSAGSAEQEWPDFAEEIGSLQGSGLFPPEPSKRFASKLTGSGGFGAAHSNQQAFDVVGDAIDVVFGKAALMSPAVAVFAEFADQAAFDEGQFVAEEFVPVVPHEDEECLSIPRVDGAAR